MHDKYAYEKTQLALHDTEVERVMAFGAAGLSVIADSLSAIKYAKVHPVIGEDGLYDFMCAMDTLSAKEMANHLLNYVIRVCNGKIRDDMTILVAKIIDF